MRKSHFGKFVKKSTTRKIANLLFAILKVFVSGQYKTNYEKLRFK